MNNKLQVTFIDGTKAVYHIQLGNKIKDVLAELENEANQEITEWEWI